MKCWVSELGTIEYHKSLELQEQLVVLRQESKIPDTLLLLEHPHVYTTGRRFNPSHLLMSSQDMVRFGVNLFHTDRGGDITYHGPGQLVGYPIMQVANITMIRIYLTRIEEMLISVAADFGILAGRMPGCPGVWVRGEKLAAIGLRISGGVSKHGFALNVSTDLSFFEGIVPCGFRDKGTTSLSRLLGYTVSLDEARVSVIKNFATVFDREMVKISEDDIFRIIK